MNKIKQMLALAIVVLAAMPAAASAGDKPKDKDKSNAAKACKAERHQLGVDAFRAKYGTKAKNGRNAFGKCVSQHAKHHGQGKGHKKDHPGKDDAPES